MISVLQLGTLDYATGLQLQRKLVDLRKEDRIGDALLLLEHPPVITLGRNAKAANVIASREELLRRGVEVFESDRGGDVTFHGPGQLVGYPIFDLRAFPSTEGKRQTLGVIEYVRKLEEVLMRTCGDFGIDTQRICGLTGVWTGNRATALPGCAANQSSAGDSANPGDLANEEAKIAAIGVHISRSVTSHGFALNVNTDLDYFTFIVPCGLVARPVTSMEKALRHPQDIGEVTNSIVRNFGAVFQTSVSWADNLDMLRNTPVGVPMSVPSDLQEIHKHKQNFWV